MYTARHIKNAQGIALRILYMPKFPGKYYRNVFCLMQRGGLIKKTMPDCGHGFV